MVSLSLSHRILLTAAAFIAVSSQTIACGPVVSVGGSGEITTSSGGGGAGGSTPGEGANAIAMLRSQFPPPSGGDSVSASSGGDLDPNMLFVFISDRNVACNDPFAAPECPYWKLSIGIPTGLQTPGTYDLSSPAFSYSSYSASQPNIDAPDCWGGGGSLWEGTLTITSIDDEKVTGEVIGTPAFDFDGNGPFDAVRCP
jgi:hypothetical protein